MVARPRDLALMNPVPVPLAGWYLGPNKFTALNQQMLVGSAPNGGGVPPVEGGGGEH